MPEHDARIFPDSITIIRRHRLLIATVLLVGVGAASAVNQFSRAVYEGEATVMVVAPRSIAASLISLPTMPQDRASALYNQIQVLRSRTLAERVHDRIARMPASASGQFLEKDGEPLPEDEVIRSLQAKLQAMPAANADVVVIRARAGSADGAQLVTNAYLDEFLDYSRLSARDEIGEVKVFLSSQLEVVEGRLHAAEESLREYQEEHKVVGLPAEAEAVVEQVTQFEGLLNESRTEYGMQKARLNHLRLELSQQMKTLPEDITEVSSPTIATLRGSLAELEGVHSQLLAGGYTDSHPKMVQVRTDIDETKRRLVETTREALERTLSTQDPLAYSQELVEKILVLEVDVASTSARIEKLGGVVEEYSERMTELPLTSLELARLERDRRVNEDIYTLLLESSEEARIAEARETGEVRAIDRAQRPQWPVTPRRKLNLAVGGMLGLLFGFGMAFVRESRDDTIKSVADIEDSLALKVLGMIPVFGASGVSPGRRHNGRGNGSSLKKHLLIGHEPHSQASESYRALRTNLCYLGRNGPPRTLVITSAGPGEGKSATASNLAMAFARQGTSVLLVDCDLRRPVLDQVFELPAERGLTDVLRGELMIDDALKPSEVENLTVLTGGATTDSPAELLGSFTMEAVLDELSRRFECVILDCPPLLPVTDAAVVAAKAEGVILVARADSTCLGALTRAKTLLENVRARVLGAVINMVGRRAGAYGDYGYSHYYSNYDSYYSTSASRDKQASA
ncbi:MAG: polysaccharide biosynthesis tyrosine autokinase [Candidatus Eisenbacteria bacterium]